MVLWQAQGSFQGCSVTPRLTLLERAFISLALHKHPRDRAGLVSRPLETSDCLIYFKLEKMKVPGLVGIRESRELEENLCFGKGFRAWERVKVLLCVGSEGSGGVERRERIQEGESLAEKTHGCFGVGNGVGAGLWCESCSGCGNCFEGSAGSEEIPLKPPKALMAWGCGHGKVLQPRPVSVPGSAAPPVCLPPYLVSFTSQHLFTAIITKI